MESKEEAENRLKYDQMLLLNRERILTQFIRKVRNSMPSARSVDDKTLENSLFKFLTTVAKSISLEEKSVEQGIYAENIEASRAHGLSRAMIPSYTLDQVISEFRILRALILSVLEESGPLPLLEREKVFFAIDNGMTQAATEFASKKGFKDARLTEEISAKNLAIDEANVLRKERKQRETFFSTVTHDIRNPLAIVKASAEMIQKHPEDVTSVQKYVAKIIKSVDRSNLMIKDLLDSNRVLSGSKLSLNKVECDLAPIIQETCDDLAEVYGCRFVIKALSSVKGEFDPQGLKRALENLLTNAIKYGDSHHEVTVGMKNTDTEVCIQVHNMGNPIPLRDQASLFDYHFRAQAQESTQQGWGIGLTLVKGIVEAHGGKVEVKSSREDGTTFFMILPLS